MKSRWDIAGPEGLAFFGRATATTTHELNNALGIINENAGLMEDLLLMAEQGMSVDPDRWTAIVGRISRQVNRAGLIAKRLSRFAHSVDSQRTDADLGPLLELAISLSRHTLAEHACAAEVETNDESVTLKTSAFHFLNLVCRCLAFAGPLATPARKIVLNYRYAGKESVSIIFTGIALGVQDGFPGKTELALLDMLGGKIIAGEQKDALVMEMPA